MAVKQKLGGFRARAQRLGVIYGDKAPPGSGTPIRSDTGQKRNESLTLPRLVPSSEHLRSTVTVGYVSIWSKKVIKEFMRST